MNKEVANDLVKQFDHVLDNLDRILQKAEAFAAHKKFDSSNFVGMRLAPDMFPFSRQIQIACDVAKVACAALAQIDAPKHEDNEKTMEDLRGRIQKVRSFLASLPKERLSDIDPMRKIPIPFPPGKFMHLQDAIITRSIPNLYFHASMAYAILRQGGVEIGKGDFLGRINILDS